MTTSMASLATKKLEKTYKNTENTSTKSVFWQHFALDNSANHPKNRARGNRKTLKRAKTMSKNNFRNWKLKSREEYMI